MKYNLLIINFLLLCTAANAQKFTAVFKPVAPNTYIHTSYALPYGSPYPSNGMVVSTTAGAVLIDTGWDEAQTKQIVRWVKTELHQPVVLCIITHCHYDRMAGLPYLKKRGVRVISTNLTRTKMSAVGLQEPEGVLPNDTTFAIGGQTLRTYFPGAGHAGDNIVVWLPAQKVLFGGCLIKDTATMGLGNLSDAVLSDWPQSVRNVQTTFPDAELIVPGHQEAGDKRLLTHTLKLLEMRPK
jgi:metallo-beta-lactamase class B